MFSRLFTRFLIAGSSVVLPAVACKEPKKEVYIWGNGVYQARPDALLQFKNFSPKRIDNLPADLVALAFGEYYEGGITSKGELFIWETQTLEANFDDSRRDNSREGIRSLQKNVKQVKFSSGYIWVLTNSGEVYQWPIIKKFDSNGKIIGKQLGSKRQVDPLKGSVRIEAGRDHLIALNGKGEIFAMGDDTLGQCGQGGAERSTCPPFLERRVKYPVKVPNIGRITQIASGGDHCLALDEVGNLFGWGSNSSLQISHEEEFSKMSNPLISSPQPIKISKKLDYNTIKSIAAGEDFSILITENRQDNSAEVFSCGSNLRGQLAIDEIRHIKDISKINKLSNYVLKTNGEERKVSIDQIECGKNHCIALLNIGYIMEWGDNERGQLGNKKRSPSLAPILLKDFTGKKVVGVFAGENSSGVIVENSGEDGAGKKQ